MEPLVQGAQFTTVCGHKFCTTCWDGWKAELVNRILTCPLCRKGQPVAGRDGRVVAYSQDDGVFLRTLLLSVDRDGRVVDSSEDDEPVYRSCAEF